MSYGLAKPRRNDLWAWMLGLAAVALLAWLGWSAAESRARVADVEMRNQLIEQTVQIAASINPELASKLTFTTADQGTPAFECLREQMIGYGSAVPGARWLYCMTKRDGKIVFSIDVGFGNAEKTESPAKPGEVYEDESPQFKAMFDQNRPFTDGPATDKWGTFVSACVPVFDQHTGKLMMLIGLDVEADDWNANVNAARRGPILTTLVMILVLIGGLVLIRWRNRRRSPDSLTFRAWIVVPTALAALAGLVVLGVYEYRGAAEESRRNMLRYTEQARTQCDQYMNSEVQLLKSQIGHIANDHAMLKAWQDRNLAELNALVKPDFEELNQKYKITHFYFVEPDRTCFLRVHETARRGDRIDRLTMVTAARTEEDAWGTELGSQGTCTLRYVRPWKQDGKVIGYLELGVEIGRLVDQLAQVMDAEIVTVIRKEHTTRNNYEHGQKTFDFAGEWDDYPGFVVVHQTAPHLTDTVMRGLIRQCVSASGIEVFDTERGDRKFACGAIHLPDVAGRDVVDLIVVRDITVQSEAARSDLLWSMGLAGSLTGGILMLLWSVTGTAEKQLSDAFTTVHASRERFAQVAETSGEMIWEIDVDGQYTYVSHACKALLGYDENELIGSFHFYDLRPEEAREDFLCRFRALCEKKSPFKDLQNQVIAKDGRVLVMLTSGVPILNTNGTLQGYRGSTKDITERQQAEDDLLFAKAELQEYVTALEFSNQALQEANRLAEAATRAKSEFLANMSHEIRTPMTAILGYADVMLEEDISRGTRDYIEVIKHNGRHLLDLINDILDLSKVETGKMQIEAIRCSPVELLEEVVSLMRVRADAKHLKLTTELIGLMPETVLTDPLRFRQVLVNLVGNAIKFTDEGEVRLVAQLTNDGGASRLCVDVIDTGIGMNLEEVERLFQAFTQVDSSATRKFGGSGMGLYISKRLAEVLGGNIVVHSTPGIGSIFSVTIDPGPLDGIRMLPTGWDGPVRSQSIPMPTDDKKIVLHGRVLLVEDGLDNQRLIRLLLKKAGADVVAVENGKLAVEHAMAAYEAGKPFDVILMDMQMPVMDGYTATQRLREWGYTGPIVALTAHAMDDDCQKCLNAGCDDYATKPIDRKKLLTTVACWAVRSRSQCHATNASTGNGDASTTALA